MTDSECIVFGLRCDVWTALTAIGTLGLTAVTLAYVLLTRRLAKGAARSADAAERTLLLESMPILLPTLGYLGDERTPIVNLRNAGRQPALNIRIRATGRGLPSEPRTLTAIAPGATDYVAVARDMPLTFKWPDVVMEVEFRDAVGNRYRIEHVSKARDLSLERFIDGRWEPLIRADRSAQVSSAEFEVPDPPEAN